MIKKIKADSVEEFIQKMIEIDDDPDFFDEVSEFEELMEEE